MMEQLHQCKYCDRKFHKLSSLTVHLCPKKQRYLQIDAPHSRFALMTFQRFYELTTKSKKPKTIEEFIDSPYYIDFVRFGNYLVSIKPVNMSQFIDFVIHSGIKLKDWSQDFVYEKYIEDLIKRESDDVAVERSITTMEEWSKDNNTQLCDFFQSINLNEAAHLIKYGKISPWVLYLSESGDTLIKKFNQDHIKLIGNIIDPPFWHKKFNSKKDDVAYITELLEMAGL